MKPSEHYYFVGIGGVGMQWLADYALYCGAQVSGSDLVESSALTRLRNKGANIHSGENVQAIPHGVTVGVINSAITPSSPSYAEVVALRKRGIPVVKRAEVVGEMTRRMTTICIAGTHGKTSTTALLGWILDQAGLDPTIFTGGSIAGYDGTRIGKGPLVLEADEYDRSFHRFSYDMAAILNIEADHQDCYAQGLPEIEQSFHRFLRNKKHTPAVVLGYGKSASIRKVVRGFDLKLRWYDENSLWPGLRLGKPGLHMRLNATVAAKIAHELGVSTTVIKKAIASFPGVARRYEQLGKHYRAMVIDDYAHHPTEITATLAGHREVYRDEKTILFFQPHQVLRTKTLFSEFVHALANAPVQGLVITPIFEAIGRDTGVGVSNKDLVQAISERATFPVHAATNAELRTLFEAACGQAEVVLCMGAGNLRSQVQSWL
jgi:UDP-N-acetylmuramate--alanine ligase